MTDSQTQTDAPTYVYKPSMFGTPSQFRLAPDALEWQTGSRQGRVAYDRIRRLRLSFRPISMQSYRFRVEIWPPEGGKIQFASSSWRSLVDTERHDAAYTAFIRELHRRIAAVRPDAVFEAGSIPWVYWPGVAVFVLLGLSMAALALRAVQVEQWLGAALIAGFFVLFVWQIGSFFRRNRPQRYRVDALPTEVLP